MIFVLLGTFNSEFRRPLISIEKAFIENRVNEETIVQSGHTNFQSKYLKITPFFTPAEIDTLYNDARLIVTHAGTGSILKGVKKGKKVIVTPRLYKFNEHVDDHQLDILEEFAKSNYILPWYENESFETVLLKTENFIPVPYKSSKEKLVAFLTDYINQI